MIRILFASAATLALSGAAHADMAEAFADNFVGSWSSEAQSASESYAWVESESARIWPDREDGVWVYQENAIMGSAPGEMGEAGAGAKDTPYFQIIVQFRDIGQNRIHATSWRIADRDATRGAWRTDAEPFGDEVLAEVACMGIMERISDGYWSGGTECPNGYRGGVAVKSRSIRTPDLFVNWDQGLDGAGDQIWGPTEGGYVFNRKERTQ